MSEVARLPRREADGQEDLSLPGWVYHDPDYFRVELTVFKVLGGIVLILPMVPRRYKEWAYAGFGINFISATVATWVVGGFSLNIILPLVLLAMLVISYVTYNRLTQSKLNSRTETQQPNPYLPA